MRATHGIPAERSNFAQTAVVSLATLAALGLLGLVLAYWTWQWFAPRAEPRAPAMAVQAAGVSSAGGLFGDSQGSSAAVKPALGAVRLLGVVAATTGSHGYAVMQLESREILAVREGEEAAPGIKLAEVHPDHIILLRNGVRESLVWPRKDAGRKQ